MPRPRILTTMSPSRTCTLVIVAEKGAYRVAVLSSHGQPIGLEKSLFYSYEAAYTRLEQEARQRQHEARQRAAL